MDQPGQGTGEIPTTQPTETEAINNPEAHTEKPITNVELNEQSDDLATVVEEGLGTPNDTLEHLAGAAEATPPLNTETIQDRQKSLQQAMTANRNERKRRNAPDNTDLDEEFLQLSTEYGSLSEQLRATAEATPVAPLAEPDIVDEHTMSERIDPPQPPAVTDQAEIETNTPTGEAPTDEADSEQVAHTAKELADLQLANLTAQEDIRQSRDAGDIPPERAATMLQDLARANDNIIAARAVLTPAEPEQATTTPERGDSPTPDANRGLTRHGEYRRDADSDRYTRMRQVATPVTPEVPDSTAEAVSAAPPIVEPAPPSDSPVGPSANTAPAADTGVPQEMGTATAEPADSPPVETVTSDPVVEVAPKAKTPDDHYVGLLAMRDSIMAEIKEITDKKPSEITPEDRLKIASLNERQAEVGTAIMEERARREEEEKKKPLAEQIKDATAEINRISVNLKATLASLEAMTPPPTEQIAQIRLALDQLERMPGMIDEQIQRESVDIGWIMYLVIFVVAGPLAWAVVYGGMKLKENKGQPGRVVTSVNEARKAATETFKHNWDAGRKKRKDDGEIPTTLRPAAAHGH